MKLQPASEYVRALRPLLPSETFQPDPKLLFLFALHALLIVGGVVAIAQSWGGPWMRIPLSIVIGHSFAGVAFVGHEVLHGAVLRSRRLSHLLGWICLLPFTVSPRIWKAWHNKVHHGNTMVPGVDPDAYPTMARYRTSRLVRFAERLALAKGNPFGWVSMVSGFTLQHAQIVFGARGAGFLSGRQYLLALAEMSLSIAVWIGVAIAIGPGAFLFAFVVPLLIANTLAMAYILTNHHLSPLNELNDPLYNSLTVTVPRFFEVLHARFGLHVEHHLFPAMSSSRAHHVRRLLQEKWPEKYQSMPLLQALDRLRRTPRVYRDHTTLEDPRTGVEFPTLLPRSPASFS